MAASAAPRATNETPVGRLRLVAGSFVAVAGTFLFRYLTVTFTNDDFVHLSRAQQIVYGEVPIRDFFDPGLALQYYASAAALVWSGHNLFGEALLSIAFIAAGAGLTFVAAARLSHSFWLAAAATFAAVMSMPRLYNYPKVFFYVLAIVVAWQYASRPRTRTLVGLAVVTAVAFLFRHDHGVYIGLAVIVLLAILHWERPGQIVASVARYWAITFLLLLPFLVFVQTTIGLARHAGGTSTAAQSLATVRINWRPVSIDLTAPLWVVRPPSGPRVNVRWMSGLDAAARRDLERRHELLSPEHVEDSTWSYVLGHVDRDHIGALVDDPAVADTHGIDRGRRVLEVELPRYLELQRRFRVLRLRLAPGVFSPGNAAAWFYYVTLLLPVAGLALLLWRGAVSRPEAAVAGMASVLCLITVQTLVRGSPDSRLPDVASSIAVVGAWVGARCRGADIARGRVARRTLTAVVVAAVTVTMWSVWTFAEGGANLENSRILTGPAGIWRRATTVTERLRSRPIDNWTREAPDLGGIVRYVFECTAPTDRLLVTWFAPELLFYTERAFAGGQVYLIAGWHASPEDQRDTVGRLERQRVPIVLEHVDSDYGPIFPIVAEYVHRHYRQVSIEAETMRGFRVLVDQRLQPTGTYEPLGTPCYR